MDTENISDIGNIKSDVFFRLVEQMTSDIEVEILKAQGINNVRCLLRANDLYSIFKIDSEELEDLRDRACMKLKDGQYMVRPAIKKNLEYCIDEFKRRLPDQQPYRSEHIQPDFSDEKRECFMNTFIQNLSDNMNRSKHRYQYNAAVRRFSSAVYGLGGRNLYQFLRLNLPGAFPSIPTLESYSNEYCTRIEEGEFRFAQLKDYLNKINCSFVYASEDCTGIVSKVQYDTETNSFVGFCAPLVNSFPAIRRYQTDSLSQLEDWFETVNQSTLVDIIPYSL